MKNLSVLSFAAVDKTLYRYRIHNAQESETNKEKQKQIHLLIVQKHLLKFGIKMDKETKDIFFGEVKLNKKNVKKISKFASKVLSIKNFYGYPGVNKKIIFNTKFFYIK